MLALQVAVSTHSLDEQPDERAVAGAVAVAVEETLEQEQCADNEQGVVGDPESVLGKLLQLAQKKQAILSSIKGASLQV
jgi:hypothetical protein